jgi:hypothetical protein
VTEIAQMLDTLRRIEAHLAESKARLKLIDTRLASIEALVADASEKSAKFVEWDDPRD